MLKDEPFHSRENPFIYIQVTYLPPIEGYLINALSFFIVLLGIFNCYHNHSDKIHVHVCAYSCIFKLYDHANIENTRLGLSYIEEKKISYSLD